MATFVDPISTLAHQIIFLEIKLARLQGKTEDEIRRQALVSYFGLLCRLKNIDPEQLESSDIKSTTDSINEAIEAMLNQEHFENASMAKAFGALVN
jgi:hypothetical protein